MAMSAGPDTNWRGEKRERAVMVAEERVHAAYQMQRNMEVAAKLMRDTFGNECPAARAYAACAEELQQWIKAAFP